MYVDEDFVHDLMAKSLDVYVKLNLLSKSLAGDPLDRGQASEYWMDPGSVRLCDDSGILMSAELFERFCADYIRRAYMPFQGGWLHYCGGVPEGGRPEGLHLHEIYCSIDGLCGINFTTGGDWPGEVRKVMDRRRAYIGKLPRRDGEALDEYFRRVVSLCPGRKGMIFQFAPLADERDRCVDAWRAVQDEVFA